MINLNNYGENRLHDIIVEALKNKELFYLLQEATNQSN